MINFTEIQGAISKIDPEIIKSLLASGGNHTDSSIKSRSVPSTPREDQPQIPISPVPASLAARYFFFFGAIRKKNIEKFEI